MEESFKQEEIEDVRIIIKANGKNYAITPKKEFGKEVAKQMRLLLADYALQMHAIVTPALDDIKQSDLERALDKRSDESSNCNKPHVMPMLLCLNTGDWIWLEKDNTYHALFEYEDKYIIKDDEGDIIAAEKELFKIIGYKSN